MNRKIILITLFFLGGIFYTFSQSKKNDLKFTISALPLFGSSENFETGINGIVIKPTIGYHISEKTSIELNFSYATLKDVKIDNINSYYNSYAFIPTLRNNFINKQKIRFFTEIGLGLGTIKYNANNNRFRTIKHEQLSGGISILNIGIGGNYYFNDKFGIELIIPYISTKNITSESINNIYSGIGPTIGFTYKLN